MEKKDEYIVKINKTTKKYYKNGKLHREAGPAIVYLVDIDESIEPLDKHLYTEVKEEPIIYLAGKIRSGQSNTNIQKIMTPITLGTGNNPIITFESPIEYEYEFSSSYWLEGINYSEEKFKSILLKQEIEKELQKSGTEHKKVKI